LEPLLLLAPFFPPTLGSYPFLALFFPLAVDRNTARSANEHTRMVALDHETLSFSKSSENSDVAIINSPKWIASFYREGALATALTRLNAMWIHVYHVILRVETESEWVERGYSKQRERRRNRSTHLAESSWRFAANMRTRVSVGASCLRRVSDKQHRHLNENAVSSPFSRKGYPVVPCHFPCL